MTGERAAPSTALGTSATRTAGAAGVSEGPRRDGERGTSEHREGDRCERDRCGQAGVFLIRSDSENVQQPDRRRHAYGRLT